MKEREPLIEHLCSAEGTLRPFLIAELDSKAPSLNSRIRAAETNTARATQEDTDCLSIQLRRDAEDTPTLDARGRSNRWAQWASPQLFLPILESTTSYFELDMISTECSLCTALQVVQQHVLHSSAARPVFFTCCGKGDLTLPFLADSSDLLRSLLIDDNPRARRFQKNIRG